MKKTFFESLVEMFNSFFMAYALTLVGYSVIFILYVFLKN
jgi:hypothetical protein